MHRRIFNTNFIRLFIMLRKRPTGNCNDSGIFYFLSGTLFISGKYTNVYVILSFKYVQ